MLKLYDYVSTLAKNNSPRPSNNIMIYDEAQRAWDGDQVSSRPHSLGDEFKNLSGQILIKLAERVADWCVVVCLMGMVKKYIPVKKEVSIVERSN